MPYTTAERVSIIACVGASDLGKSQGEYDIFVENLIRLAEAEINGFLGKSFSEEELSGNPVLAGVLENATIQAVDNWLQSYIQRKSSPIVRVDEYSVSSPGRIILTDEIKRSLEPYRVQGVVFTPSDLLVETRPARFTSFTTSLFDGREGDN